MTKRTKGFTVVELLIVIVIIAILAAISIVAYNGVQERARDAKRAEHIALIKKTILMYDAKYGGVPRTSTTPRYNPETGVPGSGGWDSSIYDDWLAFLNDDYGEMPVDPTNELVSGILNPATDSSHRAYFYYCYPATLGTPPSPHVRMGYHKEDGTRVLEDFEVSNCV